MLRCKQVADALASNRYWELPWHRRLGLRLHCFLCLVCGRYHRQVMLMQDTCRHFDKHQEQEPPSPDQSLTPDARKRLEQTILKNL